MTSLAETTRLGDFTSETLNPKIPVPIWSGQNGVMLTLANQDLVNSVTIARRNNFVIGGSNAASIPPLGSITIDGSRTVWALAPTGTADLLIFPGGGNWAPSPAQVAAQIQLLGLATASNQVAGTNAINNPGYGPVTTANPGLLSTLAQQVTQQTAIPNNIAATGVPLLNLKSATTLATSQSIAAGATFTAAAITGINQPAYNLHLTATTTGVPTKPWYTVTLKWIDTASGFTVQFDQFTAFMSSVSAALSTVIYGPADADQLIVSVTNNDTVAMTLNTAYIIISSRSNYTDDRMYQFWPAGGNMPSIPTFQIAAAQPVPTQKIIFSVNRSVGVGVTTAPDYAMPVYQGLAFVLFSGTGSNSWDTVFTDQVTGTIIHRVTFTGAPALGNTQIILPRAPVTMHITNNGTVAGTANCEVTAI
jgi:hypothetical protein